jgi:cold shock CspA family protein/ribosome-associated translation inhibitor RaiA
MENPVEIEFQGLTANEAMRATVLKHVAVLEERYGRMTVCRISIKCASERPKGSAYDIQIHLGLPGGRDIEIKRTARAGESRDDVTIAINDAFKSARRHLQEHTRRMKGLVKSHDGPPIATVKRIDGAGFGFLETDDGREIYFHRNSVLNDGFAQLAPGARVTFFEEPGEKGPQASTVKMLGKHGLR